MSTAYVNPTRMELARMKKKLVAAKRGYKLLKDKRDELMRQFLERVRQNRQLREKVEQGVQAANQAFALAVAVMDETAVRTALLVPKQNLTVETSSRNVMSVEVPVFQYRTRTAVQSDLFSYGFAEISADLDTAVAALAAVFPDMLRLAEVEKTCACLAAEIERTRRRVNALEHVMIPAYTEQIRNIRMKLEEQERSTQIRQLKVKDMILEQKLRAR